LGLVSLRTLTAAQHAPRKATVLRALRRHVFEPLDGLPEYPLADEFVEPLAGAERVTDNLRDGRVPVAERGEQEG
jgi:hypothetical protein